MLQKLSQLTFLFRSFFSSSRSDEVGSEESSYTPKKEVRASFTDESFDIDHQGAHSILMGKFLVKGQTIHLSHSQWEGDSYPLSVSQRKDILRKTMTERLRRFQKARSN